MFVCLVKVRGFLGVLLLLNVYGYVYNMVHNGMWVLSTAYLIVLFGFIAFFIKLQDIIHQMRRNINMCSYDLSSHNKYAIHF